MVVSYRHDLGGGNFLSAVAIDPKITQDDLAGMVASKDGTAKLDLAKLASQMPTTHLPSFDDLEVRISDAQYQVPGQLEAYRAAIQFQSDSVSGRYNGNVLIVDGNVQNPLNAFRGGFYDFIATNLAATPSKLAQEFEILTRLPQGSLFFRAFSKSGGEQKAREIDAKLRGTYEDGKRIAQLFADWGVNPDRRARYFAFAHILRTTGGKEITLVQRQKGMAIAADCISSPGSTPNPPFDEPDFNIYRYFAKHLEQEVDEEFGLKPGEFALGSLYLIDDTTSIPFGAVEITTPLSAETLAQRVYGNQVALKEHTALYSLKPEAISSFLKRFDVWPSITHVLNTIDAGKI